MASGRAEMRDCERSDESRGPSFETGLSQLSAKAKKGKSVPAPPQASGGGPDKDPKRTPPKEKRPALNGYREGGRGRGHGASNGFTGFTVTKGAGHKSVSLNTAKEAVSEVEATAIDLFADTDPDDFWFGGKHSLLDVIFDDHSDSHFIYKCEKAQLFVRSTLELFVGCLAQYSADSSADEGLCGDIAHIIAKTKDSHDKILLTATLDTMPWEEKYEIVEAEVNKVEEWLSELTSTFGESASSVLLVSLEKYRSSLPTAVAVDEFLTNKLDREVTANNAFCAGNFIGTGLTTINLYDVALKKAIDYLKCLRESISMPIKSANDGLRAIRKHYTAGTFTMESLTLASKKAILKLSEAVVSFSNLFGSATVVDLTDAILVALATLDRYNITPEKIDEDLDKLLKLVGRLNSSFSEVPGCRPPKPKDGGKLYECARCKSHDHLVTYCPMAAKCAKCKCAGLHCKPSTEDDEGFCDPFGLKALIEHFFFLEVAKFTVQNTDELSYFRDASRKIADTTPDSFGALIAILMTAPRKKAAAAAPLSLKESDSFLKAVASPQCQAFLCAHQQAIMEEQSRREAARLAAEEKLDAERSLFEILRQKNTVKAITLHVPETEAFEWEAPSELKTITKRLAATVEEEISEVSENSDEEDADEDADEALANDPLFNRGGNNRARPMSVSVNVRLYGENPYGRRFGGNHNGKGQKGHQSKFSSKGSDW